MLTALIDGQAYTHFIEYKVARSIDDAASSFTLTMPYEGDTTPRFESTTVIVLKIRSEVVCTGFIDSVKTSITKTGGKVVTIEGRDSCSDMIDSTIGPQSDFKGVKNLTDLLSKVFKVRPAFKGRIINKAGNLPLTVDANQSGAITDTIFSFVEKYCRLNNVFLLSDGLGNLLLTRASSTLIPGKLLNKTTDLSVFNNIYNISFEIDYSDLFYQYTYHSQGNPSGASGKSSNKALAGVQGTSTDSSIRASRFIDLTAETEASGKELKQLADWENKVRKARAETYTATFVGHYLENNLLSINKLVWVEDDDCGVAKPLLIGQCTYSLSRTSGFTTELVLKHPDAYLRDAKSSILKTTKNKSTKSRNRISDRDPKNKSKKGRGKGKKDKKKELKPLEKATKSIYPYNENTLDYYAKKVR
jgi:prophage tail gpP-like protein